MEIITIESIKQDVVALNKKFADFEEQQKGRTITVAGRTLTLKAGEEYVGTIVAADRAYDLILLPGEFKGTHADCMKWAAEQGGELFDRVEGALLFATRKADFEEAYYWTRETYASNDAYAWYQYFGNGHQYDYRKGNSYRARAVRRLVFSHSVISKGAA